LGKAGKKSQKKGYLFRYLQKTGLRHHAVVQANDTKPSC